MLVYLGRETRHMDLGLCWGVETRQMDLGLCWVETRHLDFTQDYVGGWKHDNHGFRTMLGGGNSHVDLGLCWA